MFNDPPPERRKPHPLEQQPPQPPAGAPRPVQQQLILHIPSVKPYVTYVLIAINVAIFIIRFLSPEINLQILQWGANYSPSVLVDGELHRLLTSMFLHSSVYTQQGYALENTMHIIFNMFILYAVGSYIEPLFGHLRFVLIYILGGLGGSVLTAVLSGADSYSVGASGAVFAILAAEFVYLYQHRKLLGARGRAQMRAILFMAGANLVLGILTTVEGAQTRIDNWGHVGGALGGLALAWAIGPIFIVRRHPQQPNALIGEDINPLRKRYWAVSLYAIVLMVILIVARLTANG